MVNELCGVTPNVSKLCWRKTDRMNKWVTFYKGISSGKLFYLVK
jgi:hypothetical protein